jgi:hypothetical protein
VVDINAQFDHIFAVLKVLQQILQLIPQSPAGAGNGSHLGA